MAALTGLSFCTRKCLSVYFTHVRSKCILTHFKPLKIAIIVSDQIHRNTVLSEFDAYHRNCSSCTSSSTIVQRYLQFSLVLPRRLLHLTLFNEQNHSSKMHRNCWNCGRDTSPVTELFFCDCGVVQKPANELNYFELLHMQVSFNIDIKQLGDIFRETQKKLHPDKFSVKTKEEQEFAQQQSSLLNKAYTTLLKPLSRAIYMLELQNISISEQDSVSDSEFLMAIMEINESISTAEKLSDLEEIESKNNERIALIVKEVSEYFQKNSLEDVKHSTVKLRYYTTIQERIAEMKQKSMG